MKPLPRIALLTLALVPAAGLLHGADNVQSAEDQLRAAYKEVATQLHTAQTDRAALLAQKTALTDENAQLKDQIEKMRKQMLADKEDADKQLADLHAQLSASQDQSTDLKQQLEDTRKELATAQSTLRDTSGSLGDLRVKFTDLQNRAAQYQRQNLELYKLANDILTRYEKFSLGEALAAKEPFVGTTRTKLENQVQDYQDKLLDQKLAE